MLNKEEFYPPEFQYSIFKALEVRNVQNMPLMLILPLLS